MSDDDMELIHGSGNIYRDMGYPDANLRQARAMVGARIIGVLDEQKLTNRDAEQLTGISHSEFSRIRHAQFRRFTLDRMIVILGKLLGDEAKVKVGIEIEGDTQPRTPAKGRAAAVAARPA